ncbi:MAG: UvrD-helicase domain-containing protein [Lachnospiraceae bacterium]|nr:UvrD-helicase domain-containing protein [Lachnospiraceae bacterium]
MNKEELLNGLNEQQKEAVRYLDGPLLILAGAGSGKTRVLTHRIGYLIESGIAPWNILAITFTNKAAGEMRARVDGLLQPGAAQQVFVSTFHSMCVRLLRRDIDKLGYQRDFTIYDTDDQRTLVRSCVKALGLDTKMYRERAVLGIISSSKNEMTDAESYEASASDFYERGVARIYAEYERQMKANNALDFDDLLIRTVQLFRRFPEVLEHWQERFRYIMVDEYQDTNNVQFELVRLLAERYKNLCVVGDDDQSIYRFRGANIENILSFEKTFPGAKVIKLEQNYRSTKSILNAANLVIRNNRGRKEKQLWTDNEEGMLPVYTEYDTAAGEADRIIRQAAEAVARGARLKDQAVLYRTNAQSRLLEEKCIERNVPYIIVGGVNFYQRKEIKDVISYLRVIANDVDDLAALRVINVPKRGIGQTTVDRVTAFAAQNEISFYTALTRPENIPGIGSAAKKIRAFTDKITEFRRRLDEGETDLRGLIEAVRDETGYREELEKEDPVTAETRLENIEEMINKAVGFEADRAAMQSLADTSFVETERPEEMPDSRRDMLAEFLEEISLVADIDRTDDTEDVLTMMTLHSAKGLEFDTVYLCGMEDGLFPSFASINALDPEAEIEEERRLCYVGFTRARKKLYLSSAKERMVNGEMRYMKVSRFIDELPDEAAEKHFKSRRSAGQDSFRGFGGYEGRMEYGLSGANRLNTGYDSFGGDFGSRAGDREGYSAYNAFNTGDGFGHRTIGRFGSLDTSSGRSVRGSRSGRNPAGNTGRSGNAAGAKSLDAIPGLRKGFGAGDGQQNIKQKPAYGVGDRVSHIKFGTGTVTALTEGPRDYEVTVDFDSVGTKRMLAGFAKLQRI